MESNNITQIGSFTVCSVNENGDTEFLETLDRIESIEVVAKEKPEEKNDEEMIFSLLELDELDEVTYAVKMTFWTRIKLWFWYHKLMIQKRLIVGKFKRSFSKAAKVQARYERRIK